MEPEDYGTSGEIVPLLQSFMDLEADFSVADYRDALKEQGRREGMRTMK